MKNENYKLKQSAQLKDLNSELVQNLKIENQALKTELKEKFVGFEDLCDDYEQEIEKL